MRRGEIWWVSFDPSLGGDTKKKRPAVIVSNDSANQFPNRVPVVPVTKKLGQVSVQEMFSVERAVLVQLGISQ